LVDKAIHHKIWRDEALQTGDALLLGIDNGRFRGRRIDDASWLSNKDECISDKLVARM
jgi:hypothetical protein